MSALCPLSLAKRTLASDRHPIAIYEYTLARASQLGGDLEAEGPRLTRRDVVVGVGRGPIALVEDVLDIELRLPGRVDLRIDAGVEAQEARQVDAVVGRRVRIREVDGAERGRPDRIDLILVPPRELMERNELNAVAGADGGRGVARHPRIGVGVAEPGLPTIVDVTLELGLEPRIRLLPDKMKNPGLFGSGSGTLVRSKS